MKLVYFFICLTFLVTGILIKQTPNIPIATTPTQTSAPAELSPITPQPVPYNLELEIIPYLFIAGVIGGFIGLLVICMVVIKSNE